MKLKLDDLMVESFETSQGSSSRGTVAANQYTADSCPSECATCGTTNCSMCDTCEQYHTCKWPCDESTKVEIECMGGNPCPSGGMWSCRLQDPE
jgi:hypothetical protein